MSNLVRFSVSVEKGLYDKMNELIEESGYGNRSEFIRDLLRGKLVEEEWGKEREALGSVTLVYDHHKRDLSRRLTEVQHEHHDEVLVSTHVHLDRHLCAEVILVKGPAGSIRALADKLGREKGVLHSALSISSTGENLA